MELHAQPKAFLRLRSLGRSGKGELVSYPTWSVVLLVVTGKILV